MSWRRLSVWWRFISMWEIIRCFWRRRQRIIRVGNRLSTKVVMMRRLSLLLASWCSLPSHIVYKVSKIAVTSSHWWTCSTQPKQISYTLSSWSKSTARSLKTHKPTTNQTLPHTSKTNSASSPHNSTPQQPNYARTSTQSPNKVMNTTNWS